MAPGYMTATGGAPSAFNRSGETRPTNLGQDDGNGLELMGGNGNIPARRTRLRCVCHKKLSDLGFV